MVVVIFKMPVTQLNFRPNIYDFNVTDPFSSSRTNICSRKPRKMRFSFSWACSRISWSVRAPAARIWSSSSTPRKSCSRRRSRPWSGSATHEPRPRPSSTTSTMRTRTTRPHHYPHPHHTITSQSSCTSKTGATHSNWRIKS